MSIAQAVCPKGETLRQFLQGRLAEAEAEGIEQHLAQCPSCGDTLQALEAGDTLHDLVRAARQPLGEESVIDGLVARLRELPPPAGQADDPVESAEPSESLAPLDDALAPPEDALAPPEDALAPLDALGPSGIRDERAQGIVRLLRPPQAEGELGRLGAYRVLSFLGAGGMGVVFRAEDEQLRRATALKVLRPSLGAGAHERFVQEARSAAAISHDHVVTIYQVGEDNGLAYLAMQFLEGETLEDRLKRETKLPPAEVLRIGRQIAQGLAAAHAKHLIHRDVKPANIWLEAGTGRAKLLDFGLARALENDPRITESGMIAGTPSYMSPEQAVGGALDERSDLFSLGCVLYRAATGEPPFPGTNALATLRAIEEDDPRPPQEVDGAVPAGVSDLVKSLLAKAPQHRPESAAALAEMIERIEQGLPVTTIDVRSAAFRPSVTLSRAPVTLSEAKGLRGSVRDEGFFASLRMTSALRYVRPRWIAAVAVTLALAGTGYFAGPQIIRIATNRGQLVIETDDPNVTIEVQGEEAKIIDLRTGRKLNLKAGSYEIKLSDGAEGLMLSTDKFTLTRGGKAIVQVRQEPAGTALAGAGRADQLKADERTFDAKTFQQWLVILETERKPERLAEGVRALTTLATKETTDLATRKVLELMREWGSKVIDNSPRGTLIETTKGALWSMPAASVVPAVLAEIKNGNVNSREFMIFMIYPAELPFYDTKQIEEHNASYRREYIKRADQFVSSVFELTRDDSARTRDWAVEFLVTWCEYFEIDTSKTPGVRKRLEDELSSNDPQKVYLAARFLTRTAADSPGLVPALTKLLENPGYQSTALGFLRQLGPKAATATTTLVRMLTSVLKEGYYVKRPDVQQFGPGTFGGGGNGFVSISFVADIIRTIGGIGPDAREALPLLEEVARDPVFMGSKTPELREPANEAIAKVKGTAPKKPAETEVTPKKPDGKSKTSTPAKPAPPKSGELSYDGKTFDEWLVVIDTERNPLKLISPVWALSSIAADEKADVAARAIFRLMRVYGFRFTGWSPSPSPEARLMLAAHVSLWRLPPSAVTGAMIHEIKEGNARSREFLLRLFEVPQAPPQATRGGESITVEIDPADMSARSGGLHRQWRKQADEMTSAAAALLASESEEERLWSAEFLGTFCNLYEIPVKSIPRYLEHLQKELKSTHPANVIRAAHVLVDKAPDTPGLPDAVLRLLNQVNDQEKEELAAEGQEKTKAGESTFPAVEASYLVRLVSKLGPRAAAATPVLLEMMSFQRTSDGQLIEVPDPAKAVRGKAGSGRRGVARDAIIIEALGNIGRGASDALPLLELIRDRYGPPVLIDEVRKAIAKIKGDGKKADK